MSTREEIAARLRGARERAGFATAAAAVRAHQWISSTYLGHENASRGIKGPDLAKYADAFDVSVEWLAFGKSSGAQTPSQQTHPGSGFSEGAIAPFHARSDKERLAILSMAEHARPTPRHPTIYKASRHVPGISVLQGDIILMDLHAAPRDGQTVIAQIETENGEFQTHFAHYQKEELLSYFGETTFGADRERSIMGTLVMILRWP